MPQGDRYHAPKLPRHLRLLNDHLKVEPVNEKVGRLVPRDRGRLRKHLEEPGDDAEAGVADIWRDAVSETRQLFVDLKAWERIVEKHQVSWSDEGNLIHILSMPDPKLYSMATILGANLECSLLFAWFQTLGVTLVENKQLTSRLRYTAYPRTTIDRLDIDYLLEDRSYSKYLRNTKTGNKGEQADLDRDILNEVGDKPFLLVVNKDYRGELTKAPNATVMPTICHGLNSYSDHTIIVFMAALNRPPAHTNLLLGLGLSADVIRTSSCFETVHQCLMRTNLRVPTSSKRVRIIVADQFMANYLVHLFPGVNVRKIGSCEYQAREPLSKSERRQRAELKAVLGGFGKKHASTRTSDPQTGRLIMTVHGTVRDEDASDFRSQLLTALGLKNFLKKSAKCVRATKEDSQLFNLTAFEPRPGSTSYRTQQNIKSIYGPILDFDGGKLIP